MFCCHNRFTLLLSARVSLGFLPSLVAHRRGKYLFVCNQELIFFFYFLSCTITHKLLPFFTCSQQLVRVRNAATSCLLVVGFDLCFRSLICGWLEKNILLNSLPPIQSDTCLEALVIITCFRRLLELTAVAIHKLIALKLCLPWTQEGCVI